MYLYNNYEVTKCLLGSVVFLRVTVVHACIIIIKSIKHQLLKSAIIRWHFSVVNTFPTMIKQPLYVCRGWWYVLLTCLWLALIPFWFPRQNFAVAKRTFYTQMCAVRHFLKMFSYHIYNALIVLPSIFKYFKYNKYIA